MAYLYNYSFFYFEVNLIFLASIILSYINSILNPNSWKKPKRKPYSFNKNYPHFVKSVSLKIPQIKRKYIKKNNNKKEKKHSKSILVLHAKLLYINTAMIPVYMNPINFGNAITANIQKPNPTNNNVLFANAREKCSSISTKINSLIFIVHFQVTW